MHKRRFDWKGLGYLVSIAGVLFLAAIAWPKHGEPLWHTVALIAGIVASVVGMAFRYKSHLNELSEIRRAESDARRSKLC